MKEKNKKILKGLGVGALACVGMFGLTGCANIEVSQDKVDNIIETVEKADSRLDEYIDLLERQNQQLQEQNSNLEELLKESQKISKEDVWNFAMTSDFNFMMNVYGARDNFVVTAVNEELGLQQDIAWYYNSEGTSIFAELNGNEQAVITNAELWYQKDGSNVVTADLDKAGTGFMCDYIEEKDEIYTFESCVGIYRGGIPTINSWELTYQDLDHYEILENGNVRLTFMSNELVYQNEQQTEYVNYLSINVFEYSKDGRLVELETSYKLIDWELSNIEHRIGMFEELNSTFKYLISYGTVNVDLIESWVEIAEAKRNEQ